MTLFNCCKQYAIIFFFFFQAEDGIRDLTVTGVQTCALPIYRIGELRLVHRRGEALLAERQQRAGRRQGQGRGGAHGARELGERHTDAHGRAIVRAVEGRGIALVYDRVRDDEQAVAQVVEDQERVREEEDRVRE